MTASGSSRDGVDVAKAATELKGAAARPAQPRWLVKVLAVIVLLAAAVVAAEAAAAAFYFFVVSPQLEARRVEAGHYYRPSRDAVLAYELAPGFKLKRDERDLAVNSFGLRGAEPATPKSGLRFAVLGDSVTFGILQGEAQTVPHLMQDKLRRDCTGLAVEVLNLGVPGYGAQELAEQLRTRAPLLSLDGVVYLFNLNDFARRGSIYEGADSGLYRMYQPPALKLPFLVRKAFYRWHKGGNNDGMTPSLDWYRWLIHGTPAETLGDVGAMNAWATNQGIGFATAILPSGVALAGGSNALADEHRMIGEALRARGVRPVDDINPFLAAGLFDETDHMTDKGNDVLATHLNKVLVSAFPDLAAKAACRAPR